VSGERYVIRFQAAARRAIAERLPESVAAAVLEFCEAALAVSPRRVGKPLFGPLAGCHGARRGTYRIIYGIDEQANAVQVLDIDHRADIYHRPLRLRGSATHTIGSSRGLLAGVATLGERAEERAVADIGRRHACYYQAMAEQADRPLRTAGQGQWMERLQAEAGNLGWLAGDLGQHLGHSQAGGVRAGQLDHSCPRDSRLAG
jgi:mRNA interferase RelE/StbE